MDKNIAALLREDTKTVHVSFDLNIAEFEEFDEDVLPAVVRPAGSPIKKPAHYSNSPRLYTYVTHLPVAKGDTVVVEASGQTKLATVIRVDAQAEIEPNSSTAYKWVIDKVDLTAYSENQERNAEIERTVGQAYRANLRRSFAQTVIGAIEDGAQRDTLTKLLKG